jgi:antagonist of KipI
MFNVKVQKSGLAMSMQAAPRLGARAWGIGLSGAADAQAAYIANALVGNPPEAAVLELHSSEAVLHFEAATLVAVSGGGCDWWANDQTLPRNATCAIPAGTVLRARPSRQGWRAYLAVKGGWVAQQWLGSRSTDLKAERGGLRGRLIQKNDVLQLYTALPKISKIHCFPWRWPAEAPSVVRLLPGVEADRAVFEALCAQTWQVMPQSNRMGLRLGGSALAYSLPELWSSAVCPGTVQLPPSGQPIVLMADAQTVGGYPRIAQVAAVDLSVLAQLRPDDPLRFCACTWAEATQALVKLQQLNRQRAAAVKAYLYSNKIGLRKK